MSITPAKELEERCHRLQNLMAAEGLSAVICQQNADLLYFTGTLQSGCLWIPAEGLPIYMVRRDFQRAQRESQLCRIVPFHSLKKLPSILAEHGYSLPDSLGLEMDVLPVSFFERYRQLFPQARWQDATPLIRRVRMIKSPYELEILKEAGQQVDRVYRCALESIREGVSELELSADLERVCRLHGHSGYIRMRAFNGEMCYGHVLSGDAGAVPAYTDTPLGGTGPAPFFGQGAGHRRFQRNEPILVDFSGCIDGYLVDQTRVFSLGNLPARLMRGYEAMLAMQAYMLGRLPERPSWTNLYEGCLDLAAQQGYADQFMGRRGAQVSFIGHGIGLEIDEYPFIARGFEDQFLEPGMVFAFEPKLVFAGEGAVGIENTFAINQDGSAQTLTISPQHLVLL